MVAEAFSVTSALPRRVWQIGSGDPARPYAKYMIEHHLVCLGPGSPGDFRQRPAPYSDSPPIKRFHAASLGDLVVVRFGRKRAEAVGVLGDYNWSDALDDVEGWATQHFRRVRWLTCEPRDFESLVFPIGRFTRCENPAVLRWVEECIAGADLAPPDDHALPRDVPEVDPLDLEQLSAEVREVQARAAEFHDLSWAPGGFGCTPSENEGVAHLVVPLLRAIGWEWESIALGWKYTDVALFDGHARSAETCRLLIEAKRIGDGLGFAQEQAKKYVAKRELRYANFAVTDGIRYVLYLAENGLDPTRALKINLQRPRTSGRAFLAALRPPPP